MRKLILLKVLFNASTRLWSVYLTMEVYLLLAHDDSADRLLHLVSLAAAANLTLFYLYGNSN